jgi:toxin CptA
VQYSIHSSAHKRVTPLHIQCGTSRRLQLIALVTSLFGGGMLLLLVIFGSSWFLTCFPVLALQGQGFYRRYVTRSCHDAVINLHRYSDGCWQIHYQSGQCEQVMLLGDSILLPGMMILKFSRPGTWRKRVVVLMPDALGQENYRRTCVTLLTSKTQIATA